MSGVTLKIWIDDLVVPKDIVNGQVSYNLFHKSDQELKQVLSINKYKYNHD
jgi:hypothetical protein